MSDPRSDLAEWFEQFRDEKLPLRGDADLFAQFGIDGDEAFEFMESFAARFGVDADNYRWYFHHGEEGWGPGELLFAPPNRRVERLPITPDILIEAIRTKRWPLQYPPHRLPKVRWDLRVNQLLVLVLLGLSALWVGQRLFR